MRLFFLILIAIVAISTASVFIKLCDAPALIIAAYRMGLVSLLLLPYAGYRGIWKGWRRQDICWLALSGLFLGFHFAFWIASLKYTSVASSVVLVTSHPVLVGLGASLFLDESLRRNLILGIVLSVSGSVVIGYGDMAISQKALMGDVLALLGAISASGYLLVGRKMRKDQNLIAYIFPVYSTAALVLIFLCLILRQPFFGYSPSTYLWLVLLAVIPQLIGHTIFNWALKYLPAAMIAITILGETIGSTALAYLILGEGLTLWKVLGGILIFSGILVATIKRS